MLHAHLPLLAPGRGVWVMTRTRAGHWESQATVGESMPADRERAARRALGEADPVVGPSPTEVCFPMIIGGVPEGVLGVAPEPAVDRSSAQRAECRRRAARGVVEELRAVPRGPREQRSRRDSPAASTACHALEVLDAELRRARRSRLPLSLVMFDLDNFKGINDRHGHLCGDAVLAAVGATMKAELRGSDLKCRYGGDEFMVILPDTPLIGAKQVSENLRRAIAEHPVTWNDGQVMVTASFGITSVNQGEHDPLSAIARADTALYRAKQRGRNGIELEEQPAALAS